MEAHPHILEFDSVVAGVSRRLGPGQRIASGHRWMVRRDHAAAPLVVTLMSDAGEILMDVGLGGGTGGGPRRCVLARLTSISELDPLIDALAGTDPASGASVSREG